MCAKNLDGLRFTKLEKGKEIDIRNFFNIDGGIECYTPDEWYCLSCILQRTIYRNDSNPEVTAEFVADELHMRLQDVTRILHKLVEYEVLIDVSKPSDFECFYSIKTDYIHSDNLSLSLSDINDSYDFASDDDTK